MVDGIAPTSLALVMTSRVPVAAAWLTLEMDKGTRKCLPAENLGCEKVIWCAHQRGEGVCIGWGACVRVRDSCTYSRSLNSLLLDAVEVSVNSNDDNDLKWSKGKWLGGGMGT